MIAQIITENGQKKLKPLTADAGAGNPVGTIIPMYKKSSPSGYLYCDGSTFDQTKYPLLYAYLGSNVLPDYREFALVGAEENTTDVYNASTNPNGTIHDHDVYTQGQAKDDQEQKITGNFRGLGYSSGAITDIGHVIQTMQMSGGSGIAESMKFDSSLNTRAGTVTRGKRKAVYFYIKATSGLSENAQDNVVAQLNEQRSYSTEEHLTGKKWIDGKPIYRKVVDVGSMPNTAQKNVSHNIENLDNVIKADVVARNNTNRTVSDFSYSGGISIYVTSTKIIITTSFNASDYSGYEILEYTKTTD